MLKCDGKYHAVYHPQELFFDKIFFMHERTSQNVSYSLVQGCCRTCKKNMAPMGGRPFASIYKVIRFCCRFEIKYIQRRTNQSVFARLSYLSRRSYARRSSYIIFGNVRISKKRQDVKFMNDYDELFCDVDLGMSNIRAAGAISKPSA